MWFKSHTRESGSTHLDLFRRLSAYFLALSAGISRADVSLEVTPRPLSRYTAVAALGWWRVARAGRRAARASSPIASASAYSVGGSGDSNLAEAT